MSLLTDFPLMSKPVAEKSFLVIGYGSQLRGDDGIGQAVAEGVAAWNLENVRGLPVHQLTPELAETLTTVDGVIFVDAQISSDADATIQVTPLAPLASGELPLGHYLNPESLLTFAQILYGIVPQAWLISVPGVNFELSDRLSPQGEVSVTEVLQRIHQLVNDL